MDKKISVIMGIYNCEDTLAESIESVLNQTYSNWELIMCDDASVDNTYKIAEKYTDMDKRIKVIKNIKNEGLAFSLNKCLEIADGQYIARHDSDDICILNRFEKQIQFMESNNFAIVGSNVEYFDASGTWGRHIIKQSPDKLDVFKQSMFSHPTILVKASVMREVNGYTVSDYTFRTEDYDLFSKIYAKGYLGYNIQEALLKVRRDKDAYKRRKFKYRIDESKCKYIAWKRLNISFKDIYVIVIPIIKGIIPKDIFRFYHNLKFSKQ